MRALRVLMAVTVVTFLAGGCGSDGGGQGVDAGDDGGAGADGGDGTDAGLDGGTDAGTDADGGTASFTVTCQGKLYACGNLLDDDQDGLVDSQDPDCLGPCDNNESGFDPNISGGGSQNCNRVDCYFDQDSGSGNDTCEYDLSCDPNTPEPDCAYDSTCTVPAQTGLCLTVCEPLTPNGCDCFGCCNLSPVAGEKDFRYIGTGTRQLDVGTCTLTAYNANPDDTEACAPCEPVLDCGRSEDCGRCQLCLNKTVDDLPEDCFESVDPGTDGGTDGGTTDGGATNPDQCPGGEQPCGLPGQAACEPGYYCITGCCRQAP